MKEETGNEGEGEREGGGDLLCSLLTCSYLRLTKPDQFKYGTLKIVEEYICACMYACMCMRVQTLNLNLIQIKH